MPLAFSNKVGIPTMNDAINARINPSSMPSYSFQTQTSTPAYAVRTPQASGGSTVSYKNTPTIPLSTGNSTNMNTNTKTSATKSTNSGYTPSFIPTQAGDANTYGKTIIDTSGRTGVAKFDSLTGKPLVNPIATSTPIQTPTQKPIAPMQTQTPTPFNAATSGLITNSGLVNTALANRAQDIATQAGQKISDIGLQGARGETGYLTTGTSPVGEGNAAVIAQSTSAQQRAVSDGANMQLQGVAHGLTAQGQTQSALSSAGALTKPELATYSNQAFNPSTGQFSGGDLTGAVSGIAEKIKSGAMSYQDGAAALSGYGQGGVNALQSALGPGFNINTSNANSEVQGQQQQQIHQYTSALQQGKNLQSQLSDLITTFGLNPNDVNAVNVGLQKIAANTSSTQYKTLSNYVNDIANTYAQILTPSGGSQTDTTRGIAASMLDATANGQSIIDVMRSLDSAAQAKIAGVSTFNNSSGSTSGGSTYKGYTLPY